MTKIKELSIEEVNILQQFIDEGYKIEYEGEKEVKMSGIYHPLVQHHYDCIAEEVGMKKYHIIGEGGDEELLTYSFDSPEDVLVFIIDHYKNKVTEGVVGNV